MRSKLGVYGSCLLLGAVCIVVAAYLAIGTRTYLSQAVQAKGEIIELVADRSKSITRYAPKVLFIDDAGAEVVFVSRVASNPPVYRPGQEVDVYYSKANPELARINHFFTLWGGACILAAIAGVFFLCGAALWLQDYWYRQRELKLKLFGAQVKATVKAVEPVPLFVFNRHHPYRIYAYWLDPITQKPLQFRSRRLWVNPSRDIPKDGIWVFFDKQDPSRHIFDLSFLSKDEVEQEA